MKKNKENKMKKVNIISQKTISNSPPKILSNKNSTIIGNQK